MPVTAEFLLRGAALALEQCGFLLRDAVCLYDNQSYANAVVQAVYAWEELGRSRILLKLRHDVLEGASVDVEQVEIACEDHVTKLREGMAISTLIAESGGLKKLLTERAASAHDPQNENWKTKESALAEITKRKDKRTPEDRHAMRKKALYVQPTSSLEWNRPADISEAEARQFLQEAVNDYTARSQNLDALELFDTLCHRPNLPNVINTFMKACSS
jgi:AbiV family abortive infection protein